jgi:hypothetical protein
MKRIILLLVSFFVLAVFVSAADPVKKVVKDIKQTAADTGKAGKAVVEKGMEAVNDAAIATTQTAAAVEKVTEKAGNSLMEKLKDIGRRIKRFFSK